MRTKWKLLCLLFVAFSLCSCATTQVKDTWRNPSIAKHRLHKLVVVSIRKNDANRRVYEEVISTELNRRGIEAVPGYLIFGSSEKMETATLHEAFRKAAAQAVLTVQTVRVERQTVVQPSTPYPGYWYPGAFPSWSFYGYYDAMYYEPSYVSTYDIATLQVNLFDTQNGMLIWAATLENSDPAKTIELSKDVARIVAEELAKEGML